MIALTSLNRLRECNPCTRGWKRLLVYLGKTCSDNEPLEAGTILDACGIADAIWSLRAMSNVTDVDFRMFAVWCARQTTQVLTTGPSFALIELINDSCGVNALELSQDKLDAATDKLSAASEDAVAAASYLLLKSDSRRSAVLAAQAVSHLFVSLQELPRSTCLTAELAATAIAHEPLNVLSPEAFLAARDIQAVKFREMFCTSAAT
jgi:hypothetical protein